MSAVVAALARNHGKRYHSNLLCASKGGHTDSVYAITEEMAQERGSSACALCWTLRGYDWTTGEPQLAQTA